MDAKLINSLLINILAIVVSFKKSGEIEAIIAPNPDIALNIGMKKLFSFWLFIFIS